MANGSSRSKGRRGGAVSGPGALSKRTDLNVSSDSAREMLAGAPMGDETDLVNQVVEGNAALPPQGGVSGAVPAEEAAQVTPVEDFSLTNDTAYPEMPVTDIGQKKQTYLEDDSMMLIRAMADAFPTPELLSLLMSQGSVYKQSPDK
tara:strand:- start:3820 stop:4260 length:441 start_codon:yes stop_codon:yes gene_type:complete